MNALVNTRLIQVLTGENWNRRIRNTAAKYIADSRTPDPGELTRKTVDILKSGVVGRYDSRRAELLRLTAEAVGCSARVASEGYEYQGRRRLYQVRIAGHRSDIDLAIKLYEDLLEQLLDTLKGIEGEDVLMRRRAHIQEFLDAIAVRLSDIGQAPSMSAWVSEHHSQAIGLEGELGLFLSRE